MDATAGSAIKLEIEVDAGDVLIFDWNFQSNDGGFFNDFSFVSISPDNSSGFLFELADANSEPPSYQTFEYKFTTGGTYEIGMGVIDAWDTIVDSQLFIDNLRVVHEILGTSGNDQLNGTGDDERIKGFAGNDQINGNGGHDILLGGSGNDTIAGGSQSDYIDGGADDDTLFGNGGSDTIFGRSGNDGLYGSSAADYLDGGSGHDTLFGNGGEDTLIGGGGADLIYGGSDADEILSGGGNDTIYANGANSGSDYINTGSGFDTVWLGHGAATVVLETGAGFDEIKNFQLGQTTFLVSGCNWSVQNSADGAVIYQGGDKLAVVSWQQASTVASHIIC
ncbi:MAG: calcium-binding protein [Moorea sp. SIO2B7]|nr:calcium-binding protein [Moorena sp. SIO2B7]